MVSGTPRWSHVCIYIQILIYQPLFPRHTARAFLLFVLGTCICHNKTLHLQPLTVLPLVPSVVPSCLFHMTLPMRTKPRTWATPGQSQQRPRLERQLYFLAFTCPPSTNHVIPTKISLNQDLMVTKVRYKALH